MGKTELARALAEYLFNDEDSWTRIDMSEYQERHAVSRLVGAPPGYVGYDEGGQLTEAVRRKPYSVILLDEIEKAHPDTFNILLQVLEDGRLTDNKGRVANFKNSLIVMTSNLGSELIRDTFAQTGRSVEDLTEESKNKVFELLRRNMRPEFLNRIDEMVMFRPLDRNDMKGIIAIQLQLLEEKLAKQSIHMEISPECMQYLLDEGFDLQYGARPLKRIIQRKVLDGLSMAILDGKIVPGSRVHLHTDGEKVLFRTSPPDGDGPAA
ncbi:MAG: AAA family ATPase [Bacteroidales bacterium]